MRATYDNKAWEKLLLKQWKIPQFANDCYGTHAMHLTGFVVQSA